MLALTREARLQKVLPVLGGDGNPRGLVDLAMLHLLSADNLGWANAHDVMIRFTFVEPGATLAAVSRRLLEVGLSQLPVVEKGEVVGYVGETELARAHALLSAGAGAVA
jgi:predicted transcriptional regulator